MSTRLDEQTLREIFRHLASFCSVTRCSISVLELALRLFPPRDSGIILDAFTNTAPGGHP